ncbi:MAG: hypothetical protein IPN19_07975 [Elusimicrobia bacterium]|nr:hypothetical protein [Elusimicrobiota bacterium]
MRRRRVGVVFVLVAHVAGTVWPENNFWSERATLRRGGVSSDVKQQSDFVSEGRGSDGGESALSAEVGAKRSFEDCVRSYGALRAGSDPEQGDGPSVVLVRDLHGNKTAQQNIGSLISVLAFEQGLSLVGLEGATGPFVTDEFGSYPDRSIVDRVGWHFLNNNLISGAEFAGLTLSDSPQRLTLWGVESGRLYRSNVLAVKESLARRESAREIIQSIDGAIGLEKNRLYSPALVAFDKNQLLYDSNKIDVGAYLSGLVAMEPAWDRAAFPNVVILLRLLQAEKQVDVQQVKREQRALAEDLGKRVSAREAASIDDIEEAMERAGIEFRNYPALAAQVRLHKEIQRVDHELLLYEIERLGLSVQTRLAERDQQRDLVRLDQDSRLLGRLFRLEMTPADWATYNQRRYEILGLPDRLQLKMDLAEAVRPFESFWAWAARRDKALALNLLDKMASEGKNAALLVVGGFHTDGVAHHLTEAGVTVRVVTPNASFSENEKTYIDSFAEDPPSLRDLVNGQQIALKTYCSLAARAENDSVRRALHIFITGLTAWGHFEFVRAGKSAKDLLAQMKAFMRGWPFEPELVGVTGDGFAMNVGGDSVGVDASNNKPSLTLMASNGNKNGNGPSTANGRESNKVTWNRRLWVAIHNFVFEKHISPDPERDALEKKVERVSEVLVGAYQAGTLDHHNSLLSQLHLTKELLDEVAHEALKKMIAGKNATQISNHPLSGDFVVMRFEGLEGVIGVFPKNIDLQVANNFKKHYLDIKGSLGNLLVPSSLVSNPEPFMLGHQSILRTSILLMKDFTNRESFVGRRFFSLESDKYWPGKETPISKIDSIQKIVSARNNHLRDFSDAVHFAGWEPIQKNLKEKDLGVLDPRLDDRDTLESYLVLCNPWAIRRSDATPNNNSNSYRVPDVLAAEIAEAQRELIADLINRKSSDLVPEARPAEISNRLQEEILRLRRIATQL